MALAGVEFGGDHHFIADIDNPDNDDIADNDDVDGNVANRHLQDDGDDVNNENDDDDDKTIRNFDADEFWTEFQSLISGSPKCKLKSCTHTGTN